MVVRAHGRGRSEFAIRAVGSPGEDRRQICRGLAGGIATAGLQLLTPSLACLPGQSEHALSLGGVAWRPGAALLAMNPHGVPGATYIRGDTIARPAAASPQDGTRGGVARQNVSIPRFFRFGSRPQVLCLRWAFRGWRSRMRWNITSPPGGFGPGHDEPPIGARSRKEAPPAESLGHPRSRPRARIFRPLAIQ